MALSQPKPLADADRDAMRALVAEKGSDAWDLLWQKQVTPWDAGRSTSVLLEAVAQNKIPNGRALVPGCGRGYDVKTLASPQRFALGADISPIAVQEANKWLSSQGVSESQGKVEVLDFFAANVEPFDFIYDYTFLCALPPTMRNDWAKRMSQLVKPGGMLMTIIFPISEHKGGPPFAVSVDLYKELLIPNGFTSSELRPLTDSFEPRKGMEWVGVWIKKSANL